MKLISNNDDADIARLERERKIEMAANELKQRTRELAANILRIAAGAGKSYELIVQADALLQAAAVFGSLEASGPAIPMEQALRERDWRKNNDSYRKPTAEDLERWRANGSLAQDREEEKMVTHAMRLCAAQLLGQPTQENTARTEMLFAAERYSNIELKPL